MPENKEKFLVKSNISKEEQQNRKEFESLFQNTPLDTFELLSNLPLYMKRQNVARLLHFDNLYKQIINVHGEIMEFGVRWGPNLALLSSLRGIYEPYNYTRKIVGFDTFQGFPNTNKKDGDSDVITEGAYAVSKSYEEHLEKVLSYHESEAPIPHIKKYEIIKGDASKTLKKYLDQHQETIIAFAHFDFDLYEPTINCLKLIKDRLIKGSLISFDELNHPDFPGETIAFREVFGSDYELHRSPTNPYCSYIII
tara:strand:+ start:93 stop:851 length:759 start_codon:yes stop_codon:yes gene_type:complete